jgi:hypothetical protein
MINSMLYKKIPDTDVRKGWWVDENLHSPLLESISWNGASGDDLAKLEIDDVKLAFTPYTNVKFGMKDGIGSENNINDYPLMRAEEMILIQAEGLAKSGNEGQARQILENFVKQFYSGTPLIPKEVVLESEISDREAVETYLSAIDKYPIRQYTRQHQKHEIQNEDAPIR